MGVLLLQFKGGENAEKLGLGCTETCTIKGIADLQPGKELTVKTATDEGKELSFNVLARLDTPIELNYYRNGGILQTVLRQMVKD